MQPFLLVCNRMQSIRSICRSAGTRATIRCRWTVFSSVKSSCQFRYATTFSRFTSVQFINSCLRTCIYPLDHSIKESIFQSAKTTTQSWMSHFLWLLRLPDIISRRKKKWSSTWSRLSGLLNYILFYCLSFNAVLWLPLRFIWTLSVCWHSHLEEIKKKWKATIHPFTKIGAIVYYVDYGCENWRANKLSWTTKNFITHQMSRVTFNDIFRFWTDFERHARKMQGESKIKTMTMLMTTTSTSAMLTKRPHNSLLEVLQLVQLRALIKPLKCWLHDSILVLSLLALWIFFYLFLRSIQAPQNR